jgi:hypothetical protein
VFDKEGNYSCGVMQARVKRCWLSGIVVIRKVLNVSSLFVKYGNWAECDISKPSHRMFPLWIHSLSQGVALTFVVECL